MHINAINHKLKIPMYGSMSSHINFPIKCLPAYSTGIRANTGMSPLVSQHIRGLTEPFSTHIALVWFRAGMSYHVFSQIRFPKKAHLTLVTLERFCVFMDQAMVGQAA